MYITIIAYSYQTQVNIYFVVYYCTVFLSLHKTL